MSQYSRNSSLVMSVVGSLFRSKKEEKRERRDSMIERLQLDVSERNIVIAKLSFVLRI